MPEFSGMRKPQIAIKIVTVNCGCNNLCNNLLVYNLKRE